MDKEEAVRVVLLLDFGESQVVAAPIEMLEVRLKEGAFRDVRSSAGSNSGVHSSSDAPCWQLCGLWQLRAHDWEYRDTRGLGRRQPIA